MGFAAGFFGGFALTSSILYLSVQVHRANRLQQQAMIREQTEILNALASPAGAYYRKFAPLQPEADSWKGKKYKEDNDVDDMSKRRRPSRQELLKHQWNKEAESLTRKALAVRWEDVRGTAAEGYKAITRLVKKE
ncbi:hypothetical protein V8E54_001138 [Elaphomyces granulatus]|jgi:altered-inheritance-of-mitochondria protein 5